MELPAGTVISDEWVVRRLLGKGGMGTVYEAEQKSTGRLRALKVLTVGPDAKSQDFTRFVQEARLGSRIESDHLVEVVAAGFDTGVKVPWIAMELLEGLDLEEFVKQRTRVRPQDVLYILLELAHALSAAHKIGVVHRDLKPGNIFLALTRRMNGGLITKLLDLGIAKLVTEGGVSRKTEAVGTPLWMAPEQLNPSLGVGPQADIWAMGLIAYFMLTGDVYWRTPRIEAATISGLYGEIMVLPLEPASLRAAEHGAASYLPPGFDAWFGRAVARELSARFASVDAMMEAAFEVFPPAPQELLIGSARYQRAERAPVDTASIVDAARALERQSSGKIISSPPANPALAARSAGAAGNASRPLVQPKTLPLAQAPRAPIQAKTLPLAQGQATPELPRTLPLTPVSGSLAKTRGKGAPGRAIWLLVAVILLGALVAAPFVWKAMRGG